MGLELFDPRHLTPASPTLWERLTALQRESSRAAVAFDFPGGRVEESVADSRIKLHFDRKPDATVIAKLYAHGFHWSPTETCWKYLDNESACHAGTQVLGVPWREPSAQPVSLGIVSPSPSAAPPTPSSRLSA